MRASASVQEVQAHMSESEVRDQKTTVLRAKTDMVLAVSEMIATVGIFTGLWLNSGLAIATFGFFLLGSALCRIRIAIANVNHTVYSGIREKD